MSVRSQSYKRESDWTRMAHWKGWNRVQPMVPWQPSATWPKHVQEIRQMAFPFRLRLQKGERWLNNEWNAHDHHLKENTRPRDPRIPSRPSIVSICKADTTNCGLSAVRKLSHKYRIVGESSFGLVSICIPLAFPGTSRRYTFSCIIAVGKTCAKTTKHLEFNNV